MFSTSLSKSVEGQSMFKDRMAHSKVRRDISEKKIPAGYFVIKEQSYYVFYYKATVSRTKVLLV